MGIIFVRVENMVVKEASQYIYITPHQFQLRLWYHMWGAETGYLTISKRYNYNGITGLDPIALMQGDHGDIWRRGLFTMDVDGDTRDYQVRR